MFLVMAKGSSSQQSSTSTATSVTDNRVGVADQGVYAGAGATVAQGNDFRSFDDHSVFSVQSTDSRDMSDRSTNDYSDRRVDNSTTTTNITTLDAEVAGRAIDASAASAKAATEGSTAMLDAALRFGDSVTSEAFKNQNSLVESGFGVVSEANKRSLDFGASALKTVVDAVTKSADADRAFASEFTGRIFDTQKGADQANTEKLIKAAMVIVGIIAAAFTARSLFGKSRA